MAGISEHLKSTILQQFPFDAGSLPVRYLGLPLLTKRMTVADYTPLLEKIRSRISSWTARHLSFAGRLQLLRSVIQGLTTFWMSAFRLPKGCIVEIDKLSSAFLWSGPELNTKKAKISWESVCKAKNEGGLGLRSLAEANKVSCLKLIWRLFSLNSSLWVNWVRQHLIQKHSFWSVKQITTLGSWTWKKLLKYRDIAADFIQMNVNDGASTSFWFDNWSSLGRLISLVGERGSIDLGIPINSTVEAAFNSHRRRNHRLEDLNKIEDIIECHKRERDSSRPDQALWRHKPNAYKANFNTKKTWLQTRNNQPQNQWYKGIWFRYHTPKYSFITWLATHNRLTTGNRMVTWNRGCNVACILCQEPLETRDHLFFICPYSTQIWRALTFKLLNNHFSNKWEDIITIISDQSRDTIILFLLRYTFQLAVYSIWRERNSRLHGAAPTTSIHQIRYLDKQVRNRINTIRSQGDHRYVRAMEMWLSSR